MPKTVSLAPPSLLPSVAGDDTVYVVVETTRGSRNKLAFDEELGAFRLKKILPEGMTFPYDFGFIPSTTGGDGDPLDALVMMDEPGTAGCVVECRLVGVLTGEQGPKKAPDRNDRLIAVAVPSLVHSDIHSLEDINKRRLAEVEKFFVNYHAVSGSEYRVLGWKGPQAARRLLKEGMRKWKKGREGA
jgi:inorganic pyrophosphatase